MIRDLSSLIPSARLARNNPAAYDRKVTCKRRNRGQSLQDMWTAFVGTVCTAAYAIIIEYSYIATLTRELWFANIAT